MLIEPNLTDSREHDDAVAYEVDQMISPGGDYYPWTSEHVAEALGEISASIGEVIQRATISFRAGNVSLAGATLNYAIEGYWRRIATEHAESLVELQARERRMPDPDETA